MWISVSSRPGPWGKQMDYYQEILLSCLEDTSCPITLQLLPPAEVLGMISLGLRC